MDKPVENPQVATAVVFGITLEMLADGSLRTRKADSSPREVNIHDVDYLLHRGQTELLIRRVAEGVTQQQMYVAQQMKQAAVMQQAEQIRRAQEQAAQASAKEQTV